MDEVTPSPLLNSEALLSQQPSTPQEISGTEEEESDVQDVDEPLLSPNPIYFKLKIEIHKIHKMYGEKDLLFR